MRVGRDGVGCGSVPANIAATDGMLGTSHIRSFGFSPDGRDVYVTSAAANAVAVLRLNADVPTGIADLRAPGGPAGVPFLRPGAPNPFNAETTLTFGLPAAGRAELSIADVLGRTVRRLVTGPMAAGNHTVRWDGRNDQGALVGSGIYFARLQTNMGVVTRKMLLLR